MSVTIDTNHWPNAGAQLASLARSYRRTDGSSQSSAAAVEATRGISPAFTHVAAGRSVFLLDPLSMRAGDAARLLDLADQRGVSVVLCDPLLHAVALEALIDEFGHASSAPVLFDVRSTGNESLDTQLTRIDHVSRRVTGAIPYLDRGDAAPAWRLAQGTLTIDNTAVPIRLTTVRKPGAPTVQIRILLENGLLHLALPSGEDAYPGALAAGDQLGTRHVPQVYRSPVRHALLSLAAAIESDVPDVSSLRAFVACNDAISVREGGSRP